jgi:GDPmannose 4,6-dehydratase
MRGDEFVTRKITRHFADMYLKKTDKPLELGNIDVKRDWGFAGDYVEAMWMMLQYDIPDTYIIASGETHSVREFVEEAGQHCGFDIGWQGKDENEIGFDKKTEKKLVRINPQFYRPSDINVLLGDPTKAKNKLGWKYKINYKSLCKIMMEKDIERAKHQPWKS